MLTAAGYDPYAMAAFFERLDRSTMGDNGVPVYVHTHPLTTDRIADMEDRARRVPYRQPRQSVEYAFVRARVLQVNYTSDYREVAGPLKSEISDQTALNPASNWYGITLAQSLMDDYDAANDALAQSRRLFDERGGGRGTGEAGAESAIGEREERKRCKQRACRKSWSRGERYTSVLRSAMATLVDRQTNGTGGSAGGVGASAPPGSDAQGVLTHGDPAAAAQAAQAAAARSATRSVARSAATPASNSAPRPAITLPPILVHESAAAKALLSANTTSSSAAGPQTPRSTPSLDVLAANIARRAGRYDDAIRLAGIAQKRWPESHAALDEQLQALIAAHRYADAQTLARRETRNEPNLGDWWLYLAQASAGLNDTLHQHQAMAEKLALDGAWSSAIRQLKEARDVKTARFYDLSTISARLREFESRYKEEWKEEKNGTADASSARLRSGTFRRTRDKAEALADRIAWNWLQSQIHAVAPVKHAVASFVVEQRRVIREQVDVVIVQRGHARWRGLIGKQDAARVVDPRIRRLESRAGLTGATQRAVHIGEPHDPRRISQFDIHPLRPVLKEPLALVIALVLRLMNPCSASCRIAVPGAPAACAASSRMRHWLRRSSISQPVQCGTLSYLASACLTMSSMISRVRKMCRSNRTRASTASRFARKRSRHEAGRRDRHGSADRASRAATLQPATAARMPARTGRCAR